MANGDEGELFGARSLWRTISLWLIAVTAGSAISWMAWLTVFVFEIREAQIANIEKIADHALELNSIKNTGTDDRFRRGDWLRERELLNIEHHYLSRRIEKLEDWVFDRKARTMAPK